MKGKNYIWHGIMVVIGTIACLLLLSALPKLQFGDFELRQVDLFSQLHSDNFDSEMAVDNAPQKTIKPAFVDSCPPGVECIDDYSTDNRGMIPFYRAINERKSLGRPIRIAVLGDSYIEGDILTSDLRELLQKHFGGCGVGFVPMASEIAGFRRTVRMKAYGWRERDAATHHGFNPSKGIISGAYFTPDSTSATTELSGQKAYFTRLDSCQESSVYFVSPFDNTVTVSINGGSSQEYHITGSDAIQAIKVNGKIGRVRYHVSRPGSSVTFFGASLDPSSGIVLDNFSLRGSSGIHIRNLSAEKIAEFDQLRHYDLVIMIYGLNVANNKQTNYSSYGAKMDESIALMKECMPNTGFLLVSVGDRDERIDGEMKTMRGIKQLHLEQQNIASRNGIAFWDLFTAMGGSGSISRMVNESPRKANLDYTHINHLGGKELAGYLFDAITAGYDNYVRRLEYENE